jgi:hypothetical protein
MFFFSSRYRVCVPPFIVLNVGKDWTLIFTKLDGNGGNEYFNPLLALDNIFGSELLSHFESWSSRDENRFLYFDRKWNCGIDFLQVFFCCSSDVSRKKNLQLTGEEKWKKKFIFYWIEVLFSTFEPTVFRFVRSSSSKLTATTSAATATSVTSKRLLWKWKWKKKCSFRNMDELFD